MDHGFFYLPTLVTNVKEGIELVDEEQFGPVLPILRFDTVSEGDRPCEQDTVRPRRLCVDA
jgi:acyl-CoA reductase-like NAD-dependent aldehyde dehydrogenase